MSNRRIFTEEFKAGAVELVVKSAGVVYLPFDKTSSVMTSGTVTS